MDYRITGITSIGLVFVAIGIAMYQLFSISFLFGAVYTVCVPLVFLNVIYIYCRRCTHSLDGSCRHVLFGLIVGRLFKPTSPKPYTLNEILIALLPLVILIALPLYWLWQIPVLFFSFLTLLAVAGAIVVKGVCPGCKNSSCAMCPATCRRL
ncbi:MAG: hypothetical protein JXK07_14690 [Spirochaetes bacterium]|nr:hypothetical protein [Spirochaetota bacterium]MBN2770241.1 hypothetical protein [Spirochaetota bacterium]